MLGTCTLHEPCKTPLITQSAASNYREWSERRVFHIQQLCSSSVCPADMHMSIILPPGIIYLGLRMSFCLSLRCHGLGGAERSSQDRCVRRSSRCRGIYVLGIYDPRQITVNSVGYCFWQRKHLRTWFLSLKYGKSRVVGNMTLTSLISLARTWILKLLLWAKWIKTQ